MSKTVFWTVDPDDLRRKIVSDILGELRPILNRSDARAIRIATRQEMADILRWSLAKLDRRTSVGGIPSLLDDDRRMYIVDEVIEAIRVGTPAAEKKAAKRQAAKHSNRRNRKGDSDA